LALTLPTSDSRSVDIVRSRTKATAFSLVLVVAAFMVIAIFVVAVIVDLTDAVNLQWFSRWSL
jgi:hypothetical protein